MELEEKKVIKKLIKDYVIAIGILIVTLLLSQIFIQNVTKSGKTDATVINVSGRQRMLSQRIFKSALQLNQEENETNKVNHLNELESSLILWESSHAALQNGDQKMKLPGKNSNEVQAMFGEIELYFQNILKSGKKIVDIAKNESYEPEDLSPFVQIIADNEQQFLVGMNQIVEQYDAEAEHRNTRMQATGLLFLVIILSIIGLVTILIFHPALNYIRKAIRGIKETEELRIKEKNDFENILNVNIDMLCVSTSAGYFSKINNQFEEILGYKLNELEGLNFLNLVHEEDYNSTIKAMEDINDRKEVIGFTNRYRCKDGSYKYIEWRSKLMGDNVYSSARDVTSNKLQEAELTLNAMMDKLTNLYNRHYLYQVVGNYMEYADRYEVPLSVLILDLDFFKRVNDTWGHPIGDEILKMTAKMMKEAIRESDILVRFGGEEFLVLMPQTSIEGAIVVAEKIRMVIEEANHPITGKITASLGAAERMKMESFRHLYYRVDKALYEAKETGRNRVVASDKGKELEVGVLLIEWKKEWESTNEIIDNQHRKIIVMANQVINLYLEATSKKEIENQLNKLLELIAEHFKTEEYILKEINYPGYAHHEELHHKLLAKSLKVKELVHSTEVTPSAFYSFIMDDVIVGHLEDEDAKFFSYFRKE